jgi:hypothetical protein
MEPVNDRSGELLDTGAALAAEFVMWLLVGASAAAHVYRTVADRKVFGGEDTLALFVVALLLLAAARSLPGMRVGSWRR